MNDKLSSSHLTFQPELSKTISWSFFCEDLIWHRISLISGEWSVLHPDSTWRPEELESCKLGFVQIKEMQMPKTNYHQARFIQIMLKKPNNLSGYIHIDVTRKPFL